MNPLCQTKRMLSVSVFVMFVLMCVLSPVRADSVDRVSGNALANMPVKEVTVFKDGHAFVLRGSDAD